MTTNNCINTPNPFDVPNGGTGTNPASTNSVVCAGTTSTGAFNYISGTTGFPLTSQGAGALPQFQAFANNAGYIIQVVSSTINTRLTTTSTSFTDITGLNVSITPGSASNTVLLFGHISLAATTSIGTPVGCPARLMRGTTPISIGSGGTGNQFNATGSLVGLNLDSNLMTISFWYLDSPATTSATTYKIQVYATNAGTAAINGTINNANNTYEGVATSSITAMEVHG